MSDIRSLPELLSRQADRFSERMAFTFLEAGETPGTSLSFADLEVRSKALAARLQTRFKLGDRALLLYPAGIDFLVAFFACLQSGLIAVPATPPARGRLKRAVPRLGAIIGDCRPGGVLATQSIMAEFEDADMLHAAFRDLTWFATDTIDVDLADNYRRVDISSDACAYLQYTSGSTSTPKGVMITHANVLHHNRILARANGYTTDSVIVTWMPNFHDYGLVEGMLQPFYGGNPCYLMAPVDFVKKPIRWLRALSDYRGTHTQAPNFAYGLCARKIQPEQCIDLDLSDWMAAGYAAEQIHAETMVAFAEKFAPYGFRWRTFCPAFGLAEATLLVSSLSPKDDPLILDLDPNDLAQDRACPIQNRDKTTRNFVGCGPPVPGTRIEIVDPVTHRPVAADCIGEVWVHSASNAVGYWERESESNETFGAQLAHNGDGPFMRTGDLGFMHNGELVITGRLKDILILRGVNHYPQDIEWTVEAADSAVRCGFLAAFSIIDEDHEALVVVSETEDRDPDIEAIAAAARREIFDSHDLPLHALVLVEKGTIPKTSSGKIQRRACKQAYLNGELSQISAWQPTAPKIESSEVKVARKPSQPTPADAESRNRADDMISWLRTYAPARIEPRVMDERRCIPPHIVLDFGNQGLLGMRVTRALGGAGLTCSDAMRVLEQVSAVDLSLGTLVVVNNYLGIHPIDHHGTQALREELLPVLASGRGLCAFALTEPGAGSNPPAITTRAQTTGDDWRLSGTKTWIGPAAWSSVINVFARGDLQNPGIHAFALCQPSPGLTMGPERLTMGMRALIQNSVYLEDVPVGRGQLLGEPGRGMQVAGNAMMMTRLAFAVMSLGGMKRCAQLMYRYAKFRRISTGRLLDNAVTLARLNDLTAAIGATQALTSRLCTLLDDGRVLPDDAYVVCKTGPPEFFGQAADQLVQLLGGRGYTENNPAARIFRDARVMRIFEGPTETLNAYLGSRVQNQASDIFSLLEEFGATDIRNRLADDARELAERLPGLPFHDPARVRNWTHVLTGELATYALVWATARQDQGALSEEVRARVTAWCEARYLEQLARATAQTPWGMHLQSPSESADLIDSYTQSIGDLEEAWVGHHDGPDEPLARSQQTAKPAIIQHHVVPPPATMTAGEMLNGNGLSRHRDWLLDWLSRELGVERKHIESDMPFADFGIDSVKAVELAANVEDRLKSEIPETVVWEFPTIDKLAEFMAAVAS